MKKLLLCVFLLQLAGWAAAQAEMAYIDSISISGNRHTKDFIILRELSFQKGDSIPLMELDLRLEASEKMVLNTGLFNIATISFAGWEGSTNRVHIRIDVEEAWYIYPVPVFELADRNFNVWWVEQDRSLQRLNFGLEFTHLNFTGRKDKFKAVAKYGYTRNYGLRYSFPYLNRKQTWGITGEVSFSQNREINYATIGNKQVFYRDPGRFLYQRFRADVGLQYRPRILVTHTFALGYRQNKIDDIVARELNPDFFLDGRTLQRNFSAAYIFTYDDRDVRAYPTEGNYYFLALEKEGLGIFRDRNSLVIHTAYEHYLLLRPRWSLGSRVRAKLSLNREQQPYNDNRAAGFGKNYLRGYEYYVVDGLDMGYAKATLRYKFFQKELRLLRILPGQLREMPIKMFLTANNDFAFVNDPYPTPGNFLHNRLLWGAGFGLDVVLFYDKVLQFEYSVNHLGESGLFLHLNMNI
ncbi:MAG: BamA/TamA family outer membrane protein [Saprospiraceae bacterium]|nr:BamA/TamA family outer membrane protein [Saprospiraceae bacterium]